MLSEKTFKKGSNFIDYITIYVLMKNVIIVLTKLGKQHVNYVDIYV